MLRKFAMVAWWLGVSAYFGGILAVGAVVAPVVFDTARSAALTMPGVPASLDVSKQVGGEIFGAVLGRFLIVEVICLGVMLAGLTVTIVTHKTVRRSTWVLLGLWMILATFTGYDAGYLRPQVLQARDKYRASASMHVSSENPDEVWPERAAFEEVHARSETFGRLKAYALLGMILVGAWKGLAEKPRVDVEDETAVEN